MPGILWLKHASIFYGLPLALTINMENIISVFDFLPYFFLIKISDKCLPKCPTNNDLTVVQMMIWCRIINKPLSEPMMHSLDEYIKYDLLNVWIMRFTWWRHEMEAFSALLAFCAGNFIGHRWIPLTKGQWCGLLVVLWCAKHTVEWPVTWN